MEVDIFTILPVFYPSILILWIGSLYLRKKSVIISMGLFWGLFILMFIIMFITQIIIAYQSHLELVDEWRYGDPPTFNWYIYVFPLIAIIPLLLIFTILFKNAIMIYNIKDEDLSDSLNDTLNELNWEYDRDFTYIHVRNPKIKIKVGMVDPMRTCQIFFRDIKDSDAVNNFKVILRSKIIRNEVKPFLSVGLLFIFIGIFFPVMSIIMLATI